MHEPLESCLIAVEDAFNLTEEGAAARVNNQGVLKTKPLENIWILFLFGRLKNCFLGQNLSLTVA